MKRAIGKPGPKTDRVGDAVVIVVGLSVAMMFALLYTLTPPTEVATVEQPYATSQQ